MRAQDPRGTAVKDHNSIVLRAESMDVKAQWLHRLQRAQYQPPSKLKPSQTKVCTRVCALNWLCC